MSEAGKWTLGTILVIVATIVILALGVLGLGACKSWERSQARKDAENKVKITHIEIQRQHEYAETVNANTATVEAERHQRVVRAEGIEKAQAIISKTLTPEYIQWEAIEAQKSIATSGQNNTVIYVPSGTNGTPVITAAAAKGK